MSDPTSQIIFSRQFSTLPIRAKSPSEVLDIVGYPLSNDKKNEFYKQSIVIQSSPDLVSAHINEQDQATSFRLTIRNNNSSPDSVEDNADLLLKTSREEKTLVEDSINYEVFNLHKKLLEFEQEREIMNQRFQDFIEREEQMRKIIEENQNQLNQLKYLEHFYSTPSRQYTAPSRKSSYKTVSSSSQSLYEEPTEDYAIEDYQRTKYNQQYLAYQYYYRYYYSYYYPQ